MDAALSFDPLFGSPPNSFQPCTCTDQQPSGNTFPCGCRACVTCGGIIEWTHGNCGVES